MYNTIVQLNSDTSLILPFTPDTRNGVMITVILRYNSPAQPFLHNLAVVLNSWGLFDKTETEQLRAKVFCVIVEMLSH